MTDLRMQESPLPGVLCIARTLRYDSRGVFARLFCANTLAAAGWKTPIAQVNHSHTAHRGTVRGLHFQYAPQAEKKLVSCIQGAVWDVAVDLRRGSPTFLNVYAQELSASNGMALLIPEGFAHGFQALTDGADIVYCTSAPYSRELESGVHPEDPALDIQWPLPVAHMSARDAGAAFLPSAFSGISLDSPQPGA